ncbi:MAG: hypothetical protein ACSHYB_12395 [Roseibacillus sp.]
MAGAAWGKGTILAAEPIRSYRGAKEGEEWRALVFEFLNIRFFKALAISPQLAPSELT